MRLGHGENEVAGLPQAGRPIERAEAGQAQQDHQAPDHAHVQVGAGQEEGLVGQPNSNLGQYEGFQARRAPSGPHLRSPSVMVSQSPPRQGYPGSRSRRWRFWDHVSSGISALLGLLKGAFGTRGPRIPIEAAQADLDMAVSYRSGVQHDMQTTRPSSERSLDDLLKASVECDRRWFIIAAAATLGVMAASTRATETNLPVKIGRPFIPSPACDGNPYTFFSKILIILLLCASTLHAQKFEASYLNLEQMVAGIDTTPADINVGGPVPAYFSDQMWNGGTTITVAGPAFAAGLSKRSVALPSGVSQCTLSYQIRVSQSAGVESQANETDLMIVDAAGNLYNGSTRKNNQEGGEWQITNATGSWVDTGFKPGLFPADTWTQVAVVYQANWTAASFTILSIEDETAPTLVGAVFSLGPTFKPQVISNSTWKKGILDVQIQDTLWVAGSYTRDMRNIDLACQ